MEIKQAFEVFTIERGYGDRRVHGYAWTKEDAHAIAIESRAFRHVNSVHLVEVNGRWHRLNVTPVDEVRGDIDDAVDSRILGNDFPTPHVPGIFFVRNGVRNKLVLDVDRALDFIIKSVTPGDACVLTTRRSKGVEPMVFDDGIFYDQSLVQRIRSWLEYEVKARKPEKELA